MRWHTIITTNRQRLLSSALGLLLISGCDQVAQDQPLDIDRSINVETVGETISTLKLSSDSLDFGMVGSGETAVMTLTLEHTGPLEDAPLTIQSTSMDELDSLFYSNDFQGPHTLYPGQSLTLSIHFSPDATVNQRSDYPATLFITHTGTKTLEAVRLFGRSDATEVSILDSLQLRANPSINFSKSIVDGIDNIRPTTLQFGPDGRLYVGDMFGDIHIYNVQRFGSGNYATIASETINLVKNMPNHDDDGSYNPKVKNRLLTGILVSGNAKSPVIFVASSDPRIGGGNQHTDTNLDTNSTVISKLTFNGSWQKQDIVRGLPRSEENHHANGMILSEDGSKLLVAMGGNTNAGAISNNFALLPEFALSAAILEIDLNAIGNTTYDLPTLDDEDRPGVNDYNDPFGGNQGKNQAKLVPNGPVQVYASGFRNAYDLVRTSKGQLYSIDNGPNAGWGDIPIGNNTNACTNGQNEPGATYPDSLHLIGSKGYYAGHPNPTRGNKNNTFNSSNPQSPVATSNPVECEYRIPGNQSGALVTFPMSTNGLTEYTASNFSGQLTGDLLAAGWNNKLYRMQMNHSGNAVDKLDSLFSNFGERPLDVIAQGDADIYPGTIWVSDFAKQTIYVFEPADYEGHTDNNICSGNNPDLDDDDDGFTNADEIANGTDPCSAADQPTDADGDQVSDLMDLDDDNDGLNDKDDPFALDPYNGSNTDIPFTYDWENNSAAAGGIANLGFTGLMNNGVDDYLDLFDLSQMTVSGAAGVMTVDSVTGGDPVNSINTQEYAFQLGINALPSSPAFTAHTRILAPFSGITPQKYQSIGFYIGTGDQDNYIKLVANTLGTDGGLQLLKEVNGSVAFAKQQSDLILGAEAVDLYFDVDPANLSVKARYQITHNGVTGATKSFPATVDLPLSWLNGSTKLAVGIIATSYKATPFAGTWDLIEVTNSNVILNDDPIVENTDAEETDTATTDTVLYRINAGGATLSQAGFTFYSDKNHPQQIVTTGNTYSSSTAVDTSMLPSDVPSALFVTERYATATQTPFSYQFPVTPGQYQVSLYFAETWSGAFAPGKRVFGVNVEGTVISDIDIYAEVGANTAIQKKLIVSADNTLNIDFIRKIQNPAIKGIQIERIEADDTANTAPNVNLGPDLNINEGDILELNAIVSDDGLPSNTLSMQWKKLSGPGIVDFSSIHNPQTTASFSQSGQYEIELIASDGELNSSARLVIQVNEINATVDPALYRINIGGPTLQQGNLKWLADSDFANFASPANTYFTTASIDTSLLAADVPSALFQSERWSAPVQGDLTWGLPVPPGDYAVRLYFAEIYSGAYEIGGRVFSIEVENSVIDNLDVFAEVQANTAMVHTLQVTSDSVLNIQLKRITQNPALKALEILPISP